MSNPTKREEKLPDEILESQKSRSDLLRWKLVLCAALGAAALGLTSDKAGSHIGLLALIPLACAYVDLLCTNINLRIILIGHHFAKQHDPYESFVKPHRIVFCLEDWALYGSTYVIAGLLILLALAHLALAVVEGSDPLLRCVECAAIILSSLITMLLTRWTQQAYGLLVHSCQEKLKDEDNATERFVAELSKQNRLFKYFMRVITGPEKKKG